MEWNLNGNIRNYPSSSLVCFANILDIHLLACCDSSYWIWSLFIHENMIILGLTSIFFFYFLGWYNSTFIPGKISVSMFSSVNSFKTSCAYFVFTKIEILIPGFKTISGLGITTSPFS